MIHYSYKVIESFVVRTRTNTHAYIKKREIWIKTYFHQENIVAPGVATSECRKGYTQIINKDFARSTDFEHQSTIPTLFIPIIDLMSKTVKLKYNQKPSLSDTKD